MVGAVKCSMNKSKRWMEQEKGVKNEAILAKI